MSALAVQLERPGAGSLELSPDGLGGCAEALARAWDVLGVGAGDRIAIYDYGSSPVAYLASQAFAPYLERGASERSGATALCVDGLPDNVKRFTHVLRHFQPRFAFVRADLAPLLVSGPTAVPAELRTARLVVSADGDVPAPGERAAWEREWSGGVSLLARWDAAAFVAAECPRCRLLCVPEDLYEARLAPALETHSGEGALETHSGEGRPQALTVAARFLDAGPHTTELRVLAEGQSDDCRHGGFALA